MIRLKRRIQSFTYLNPFNNFEPYEGKIEIRWDPLTNTTSRIIHFSRQKPERPDVSIFPKLAPEERCPFCPENIGKMTSKFPKDLFGSERIEMDGITVIPNILTFDKYCIVAIISREHFPSCYEIIDKGYLVSGIRVLISLLRTIVERDRNVRYISINANFLPMSGSSVLHPHVQAIAGRTGTNYHRLLVEKARRFYRRYGKVFWDALIEKESEIGERFLGTVGNTTWYVPYAPKGNIDVGCVFEKTSILALEDSDLRALNRGLRRVIEYMDSENFLGYNLSIFSGLPWGDQSFRVNLRIVSRRSLPPTGATDANYFHILHMESTSYYTPEEVCEGITRFWNEADGS